MISVYSVGVTPWPILPLYIRGKTDTTDASYLSTRHRPWSKYTPISKHQLNGTIQEEILHEYNVDDVGELAVISGVKTLLCVLMIRFELFWSQNSRSLAILFKARVFSKPD